MKTTVFKSIEIDDKGHIHQISPFKQNPYQQLTPTKDLLEYWKTESNIRTKELEIVHNKGCYLNTDML